METPYQDKLLTFLPRLMTALTGGVTARAAVGVVLLVMLVHAVETAKFVAAWTDYKTAVRALAMGTASDSALMTMIAYAFLQHRRLATARREKKESTGRRPSRLCQPCATPSSNSSLD